MDRVSKGILIAAAAATLLATGAVQARAEEKAGGDVKCLGINSCKGKGIITVPKAECEKKGGKVLS